MFTTLFRLFRYGSQNFLRNSWLSAGTISILLLTLLVFQGLLIFRVLTAIGIDSLKSKIDISVYFKVETPEPAILAIRDRVETLDKVAEVEYVSRDKALELFKKKHENDPSVTSALAELKDNPLSAAVNIQAKNPNDYSEISTYLENQKEWQPFIEKITYRQNQLVIDRLAKIVDTTEKFGFILTFLLSLAAILVTFNTISLVIYSNREELGIMRLVGAPDSLIVGPYLVTSLIYSAIATLLSTILFYPLIKFSSPYLKFFLSSTDLESYYLSHIFSLMGFALLFGSVLTIVSATIATQKYLKI